MAFLHTIHSRKSLLLGPYAGLEDFRSAVSVRGRVCGRCGCQRHCRQCRLSIIPIGGDLVNKQSLVHAFLPIDLYPL
jgi:hypothetical protein